MKVHGNFNINRGFSDINTKKLNKENFNSDLCAEIMFKN